MYSNTSKEKIKKIIMIVKYETLMDRSYSRVFLYPVSYVVLNPEDNRSLSVIDNQDQWYFLTSFDFGSWKNDHSNLESLFLILQLLKEVVHFQYQRTWYSSVQQHFRTWFKRHSKLVFNRNDFLFWVKKECSEGVSRSRSHVTLKFTTTTILLSNCFLLVFSFHQRSQGSWRGHQWLAWFGIC